MREDFRTTPGATCPGRFAFLAPNHQAGALAACGFYDGMSVSTQWSKTGTLNQTASAQWVMRLRGNINEGLFQWL
jgi:hypothetical protein